MPTTRFVIGANASCDVLRVVPRALRGCVALGWLVAAVAAHAQSGIYTCIDAQGHRLTADRPIPACADREQRELNPGGSVRRMVGPSLSERDEAVEMERQHKKAVEQAQAHEEVRRERALLSRYPSQAAFDADRLEALRRSDALVAPAVQRIEALQKRRVLLAALQEKYTSRSAPVPQALRQDAADIDEALAFQQAIITAQQKDRERIDQRYDAYQARLRDRWLASEAAASRASAAR